MKPVTDALGSHAALRLPSRRQALALGAAALLLALLAFSLRPQPLRVELGEVTRGPLEVTVSAEGVTRVHDRFTVAAPVSGRLERLELREGDRVETGTVLAHLRPLPLDAQSAAQARARLGSARAALAEAEARVAQAAESRAQAARTAERTRTVGEAGGLSREQVERAELQRTSAQREHEAALARRRAAAAEVEVALASLMALEENAGSRVAVRAPGSGRVLRLHEQSERVLPAGTPIATVGDASVLEVVVEVLSTDAVRVRPGAPMRLVEWGGEGVLDATVRQVEPAAFTRVSALGVEEQRVNVIGAMAGVPEGLGDGYRVQARIVTWNDADALRVPTGALFRRADGWAVLVVEHGRARSREVTIGARGTDHAQVLQGLRAGDTVVLYPPDAIGDGHRVRGG
jgi:HlyD family secretion protein